MADQSTRPRTGRRRSSALSESGEYWSEDPKWSRGALTAGAHESDAKQRTKSRGSGRFFFAGQKAQQTSTSRTGPETEIVSTNKLELKMKTTLKEDRRDACFGSIHWKAPGEQASLNSFGVARYACFADDTDVSKVFKLLSECWKLKQPSVLISVTGSAQELKLEPKLAKEFETCLAEAAECTDGWVTTGGTDTGVMALVGRALRKRQLASTVSNQR